jgi:hypothetical protein
VSDDDAYMRVRAFADQELRRIVDRIPEPHFDSKIIEFANQFDNPGLIMVILTALALQGEGGLLRSVYPDPADAHHYLDVVALLNDTAAILDAPTIGEHL